MDIKIKGNPEVKVRKIAQAWRPWTLRPVDGSEPHDCCGYPEWRASNRKYAPEAFASKEMAESWVKEELGKMVKRINTRETWGFFEPLVKGTGKLVKNGSGFAVKAKWKNYSGVTYSETYAKGGVVKVEVEVK